MHPLTFAGIPDYLVILSRSPRLFFVETKTTGKECTPLQIATQLIFKRRVGVETYVLDKKPETFNEIFEFGYTEYEGYHYNKNPFKEKHKQFIIQNV